MFIVNDIEFIMCLRTLNMLSIGEFHFSDVYTTKHYLTVTERLIILELTDNRRINLFESGDKFYNFYQKNEHLDLQVGWGAMSCIHQALENKLSLVTTCKLTKSVANIYEVPVYNYVQALEILNIDKSKIDLFLNTLNIIEKISNTI